MPCFKFLKRKFEKVESVSDVWWEWLIVTEVIRWMVIVTPIYLSIWRYATLKGYTVFVEGADLHSQFWGMVTLFVLLGTLLLYIPVKVLAVTYRIKHGLNTGMKWRPSVLVYVVLCALPCMIIILVAAKTSDDASDSETVTRPVTDPALLPDCETQPLYTGDKETIDGVTITVLQTTVMGLVFTEWLSKVRAEEVTLDLITAMADDFFFAYDVIDFITLPTKEIEIYESNWCYICFVFAIISMLKYLPSQPVSLEGQKAPMDMAKTIVVSLICCDVPFAIIRISTLALLDFTINDLIHPAKNIALIVFGLAQLYMLWRTKKEREEEDIDHAGSGGLGKKPRFPQRRIARHPECWMDDDGTVWCARNDTLGRKKVTKHPEAFTDEAGNIWIPCEEDKNGVQGDVSDGKIKGHSRIRAISNGTEKIFVEPAAGRDNSGFDKTCTDEL